MSNPKHKIIHTAFSAKNIKFIFEQKFLGKNNAGLDGIDSKRFHAKLHDNIELIRRKVKNGSYRFTPYAETLLSKGRSKCPRVLGLPTMRDQLTLSCLKEYLHAKFEDSVNKNLANTHIFTISQFIKEILGKEENYSFIKADISGFYDNIDREKLMNFVRIKISNKYALKLIYRAITNPVVPRDSYKNKRYRYYSPKGVPQGLAISNILAGIYMQSFDKVIGHLDVFFIRYVDDIFLICKSKNTLANLDKLNYEISKLGLKLNEEKTTHGIIGKDSFDFLGYNLETKGDKKTKNSSLRIGVRKSSFQKLISSLSAKLVYADYHKGKFLDLHKLLSEKVYKKVLIEDLNERITGAFNNKKRYGWLFYFSQIDKMSLLHELDRIVEKLCFKSAVFEHKKPKKIKSFVKTFREIHKMRLNKTTSSNYIPSYDKYELKDWIKFLANRGLLTKKMKPEDIKRKFDEIILKRLNRLKADVRGLS